MDIVSAIKGFFHTVPAAEIDQADIDSGAFVPDALWGMPLLADMKTDEYSCQASIYEPPDNIITGYVPYDEPVTVLGEEEDRTCE